MQIKCAIDSKKEKIRWIVLIGGLVGIFTHSFCFLNKISYHDDAFCLFSVGATFDFGRWGLGVLGQLISRVFAGCFSIPIINGGISVLLLAIAGALICVMFHVEDKLFCAFIVGLMEVFPAITATYAYMFTAPYYMFAVLLAVVVAFLCVYSRKWNDISLVAAIILLSISLGIYQAYFSVAASLLVIAVIGQFWNGDKLKNIVYCGLRYVAVLALGMLGYLLINKMFIRVLHIGLSDYAGINTMLDISLEGIFDSVISAYTAFFKVMLMDYVGLSLFGVTRIILTVLWIIAVVELIIFSAKGLHSIAEKLVYWGAIALLPLAFHIVNVMISGGNTELHTLMVLGAVFEIIFPIIAIARLEQKSIYKRGIKIGIIVMIFSLIYVDNQAYFKVYLMQKEADAYYDRLITRIQQVDGYQSDLPVCFVGEIGTADSSLTQMTELNHITMTGYNMTLVDLLNDYSRSQYIKYFLGYSPEYVSSDDAYPIVKEMQCYPDDGSIMIEDNTIWVKFSE